MNALEYKKIFFDRPTSEDLYKNWKESNVQSFADFWEGWTASRIAQVTGAEIIDSENVEKRSGETVLDIIKRYSDRPYVLREPLGSQEAPDNLYINGQQIIQIENKSSTGNTATMNSSIINPDLTYFFFRRPKSIDKAHLSFYRVFYGGDFWAGRENEYEKVCMRVRDVKKEARHLLEKVYPADDLYDLGFTNCYPRMKHRDPKMNDSLFEELENKLLKRITDEI